MLVMYPKLSNKGTRHGSKDIVAVLLERYSDFSYQSHSQLIEAFYKIGPFLRDMAKNFNFSVKGSVRTQGAPLFGDQPLLDNLRYIRTYCFPLQ